MSRILATGVFDVNGSSASPATARLSPARVPKLGSARSRSSRVGTDLQRATGLPVVGLGGRKNRSDELENAGPTL